MAERSPVLWADHLLVALNKPPGVSLQTPRRDPEGAVARLLAIIPADERAALGLEADDLRLVNRLDSPTSGVVLVARDGDAHRALATAFAEGRVAKTYLALVWGHPRPREGRWAAPLGPDRADRRRMRVDAAGKPAASRYRVLAAPPHVALVELHPETGRTHQLRVHLAHAGHPIVGDDLYGGPRHHGVRDPALRGALNPSHLLLHAWRTHLPETPATPELILEAPLPPAFTTALLSLDVQAV